MKLDEKQRNKLYIECHHLVVMRNMELKRKDYGRELTEEEMHDCYMMVMPEEVAEEYAEAINWMRRNK